MLPPLSWDDLHSSAASDAKSDEEYQKHRRKLDDARRELENLKSERDSRKGPKARAPFDRQIRDLERQVAGHEKEMSQKWPDRPR
jgi:Skp family chaperone for outer membrane proteins